MEDFGYADARKTEIESHEFITELFDGTEESKSMDDMAEVYISNLLCKIGSLTEEQLEGLIKFFDLILNQVGYKVVPIDKVIDQ